MGIIDGGVVGAGIVTGGGSGDGAGGLGDGAGVGEGTGTGTGTGAGVFVDGLGTNGAVGLGDGGSTVSAAVGAGLPSTGPRGRFDSVGTFSIGGAGVLGGGGSGREGSEGPIAVDVPSGAPVVSRRCVLEHATPNALAMISELAMTETEDRRFMMTTCVAKGVPLSHLRCAPTTHAESGTRIATTKAMPARAIDSATIAFGLVSIPIKVYSTSEPSHEIHFHMIHEGCGERLKQQYVCPTHGEIERADMAKGYELTKGNFVELSKEELKALEAVASDELSIREFVPASAVDPILVERTYYLGPDKGGERAYRLLRDALEDTELVGIAAYAARGKQYIVMVRPFEDGLAMHQLRYPDEVKGWSEVPVGKRPRSAPAELGLARQIIEQLRHETFDPGQYTDEVKDRVRKLIAKKAKGGEIVAPPEAPKPEVRDLMEALKASLAGEAPAAPKRASHAKRTRAGRGSRGHATTKRPSRGARTLSHAPRARATRANGKGAQAKRASR